MDHAVQARDQRVPVTFKLAVRYQATLHIAAIDMWLRDLTKTTS